MPFRTLLRVVSVDPSTGEPRRASDDVKQEPPTAPECPHCKIAMRWFQARLERNGGEAIVHSFYCGNCARVVEVREPRKASFEPLVS
jgi:hypothetical protein